MKTVEWALSSNMYEVNTRQYTMEGTFNAFQQHLPRLQKMGVEILWFMPITPISLLGRKGRLGSYYACSSYTAVNPEFGSHEDFKLLVKAAHEMGFKVIIDWVANHTGWDHEWIAKHPEYYKKNDHGELFDAYGWEDVVDLDFNNKPLWNAMFNAMRYWVEDCDIDGFRCDMAHLVPLDFWQFVRANLDNIKKLLWVAETENPEYHNVFDATFGWELLHAMEQVYRKELKLYQLREVLNKYTSNFPPNGLRLFFTSNHDENSHSGSEWERMGNGAKAFAVLCATWQNSLPLIYSGQEIPNTKRLMFFEKDAIEWQVYNQLEHFYETIFALRKTNSAFKAGNINSETTLILNSAPDNILSYKRKNNKDETLVVLNLSEVNQHFELFGLQLENTLKEIYSSELFTSNEMLLNAWNFKVFASK